jgi:hypothetical protein
MALRFWFCATITTISALVAGFSVVGLLGPSGSDIFARYAASRSIAMLVAALSCMALRWRKGVAAMAPGYESRPGFRRPNRGSHR